MGNIVAQGDSDSIGCRIVVDGEVKAERISTCSERLYPLPGKGRMTSDRTSNERTERPFAKLIRIAMSRWYAINVRGEVRCSITGTGRERPCTINECQRCAVDKGTDAHRRRYSRNRIPIVS